MRVTKKWWFLMVALPIVALCARAGFWQLDRAAEKERLINRLMAGDTVLTQVSQLVTADLNEASFRVSLEVVRDQSPLLYLDNRIQDGRAGYEVFGYVRPESGAPQLLVNFGWVEALPRRAELPSVSVPDAFTLNGRWVGITESYIMTEAALEDVGSAVRVQSLKDLVPSAVAPGMFLAEGVLARDALGPMPRLGPETHYGYAVQWFLMTAVLLGLTGWVSMRGFKA